MIFFENERSKVRTLQVSFREIARIFTTLGGFNSGWHWLRITRSLRHFVPWFCSHAHKTSTPFHSAQDDTRGLSPAEVSQIILFESGGSNRLFITSRSDISRILIRIHIAHKVHIENPLQSGFISRSLCEHIPPPYGMTRGARDCQL